ncbi:ninja-family protein mc410 [Impatiens glandulifera]|uniref:ninja-family protein mc410 n=1 Tax=Impatiens glandulifera TaxID=253017 RepID=UPI001FB0BAD4|nr:ninja-family protein mc410 [Impatiens glandulifera]
MDDEKGLELSLGMPGCRSTSKSRDTIDIPSDTRIEEGDRTSKLIDDFKEFLDGGPRKHEGPSDCAAEAEGRLPEGSTNNKRKGLFLDIHNRKKHEIEVPSPIPAASSQEKGRPSHVSINTDDDSTADNEDVADSELEVVGSTSRLVKQYAGGGSSSAPIDSTSMDYLGQKKFAHSTEKEYKVGNMLYSISFPSQPVSVANMTNLLMQVKDSNTVVGGPSLHNLGKMAGLNGEQNPVMFGYSPVQLPVLDSSTGILSNFQQIHPSSRGGPSNAEQRISDAFANGETPLDRPKVDEAGSSRIEEDHTNGKSEKSTPNEGLFSSEIFPSIRPGIAADLKFGGNGSYPNLPWVSTKGSGPNGQTISGVTYRYSATHIKIVCACHGLHLSPEEFIRHAGEEETNLDSGTRIDS